jgi:hypothetical protein
MMDQPQNGRAEEPTVVRAAELGERVGRLASLALRRIERVAKEGMPGAPDQVGTEASGTTGGSATERAETLLGGMGARLDLMVELAGPRLRRFVALTREEAEDMWAEAQHIRRSNSGDPS